MNMIAISLEGGLVQGVELVLSNHTRHDDGFGHKMVRPGILIIDYDIADLDPDDLEWVPQSGGGEKAAYVREEYLLDKDDETATWIRKMGYTG